MKQIIKLLSVITLVCILAGTALAVDLDTLDKVSVLMPQAKVQSLLGSPEEVLTLGNGLSADIYKVSDAEPLIGTGCIYQDNQKLVAQAFIFKGIINRDAAARLVHHGYRVLEESGEVFKLTGKDDDSGQPLLASITLENDMTIIMTFEKGFYECWAK
jgi:hypothetical protein